MPFVWSQFRNELNAGGSQTCEPESETFAADLDAFYAGILCLILSSPTIPVHSAHQFGYIVGYVSGKYERTRVSHALDHESVDGPGQRLSA